jgi:hypothetical protein
MGGWLLLIKAVCNSRDDRKEGSGGRPKRSKTMLGGQKRKRWRVNERKKKALKDLDDRRWGGKKNSG